MSPGLPVSAPVTVVGAETGLLDALAVMERLGVRHLPVLSDDGDRTCLGLLTDRDVLLAVGADPAGAATRPVRELCRSAVPRVEAGSPAGDLARAVLDGGADAALVVDGGLLVGIVTATDALRALAGRETDGERR